MKVYQYECSSTVLGTQTIFLLLRYVPKSKVILNNLVKYSLSECY